MTHDAIKRDESDRKNRHRRAQLEEEECQDKVCSDTKQTFKSMLFSSKNKNSSNEPECPLDRNDLGRYTWSLLHTMASKYPLRPTTQEKTNMREFIRLMSILYPCEYCAKDFRKDIQDAPPKLESREELTLWFCQMHNKVNDKLGKPQFDCSKVNERWRTGWKDGSCN